MRATRLLWQLYPSYLFITILTLIGAGWYATSVLREFYAHQVSVDLEARARLLSHYLKEPSIFASEHRVNVFCKKLGRLISTRITVILPSGKVIGDSDKNPDQMDNHANRPEVVKAMAGKVGTSIRYSHTLHTNMMYVAIPLKSNNRIVAILRTSTPLRAIDLALGSIRKKMILGGVVAAILSAVLCFLASRRISGPLEELTRRAKRFARGDMSHELTLSGTPSREVIILAEAMNRMAVELDRRMKTVLEQKNELNAILSSMSEGVLAVDLERRISTLNGAAAELFSVDQNRGRGRKLEEVIRNAALQELVEEILSYHKPVEREIVLHQKTETFLQAHGTPLRNAKERKVIGALVVLNDITRLRRMERIRRDFVANVSHELKTPITAIKGFVETLLNGAIYDEENNERFLAIVDSHANRLERIIEDLLTLSRLEQQTEETTAIEFEEVRIVDVVNAAKQACILNVDTKDIRVEISVNEALIVRAIPPLLEQAIVNLLDNAIKYSEPKSHVHIEASETESEVIISVRDHGCGIAKEHLSRLFERFYRVDKARSRKLGGTGLGLAIVKHVAQLHGGRVSVESTYGKGSIFSIHIPHRD